VGSVTPPWPRDRYVAGGGRGEIALIVLTSRVLPDPIPISRSRHGMQDADAAIVPRERSADPIWFEQNILAPFADMIVEDLGPTATQVAFAAERAYVISAGADDPEDLAHLQAAWALAKCVCEESAAIVIDVFAARAYLGSEIATLAPDRAFDVMTEVTLLFDERPDGSVSAWTAGMRKFGRPDIVVERVGDQTEVALALRDAADRLARGEIIDAPVYEGDLPIDGPAIRFPSL
jgi:hypothetical protein